MAMFEILPYPPELEAWWLAQSCGPDAASHQSCLEKLVPAVARLSGLFTTERDAAFGDYGRERSLLLAYGLFFYPQTYTRVQFPLGELLARGALRPGARPLRILDLGTGSGAALTGAVDFLRRHGQGEVEAVGIDQAAGALSLARDLAAALRSQGSGLRWSFAPGNLADLATWPAGEWDLILSSFALNEAFHGQSQEAVERWTQEVMRRLSPQGLLLLVEPALRETSERLEALRDWLAASGHAQIAAPCLHAAQCPLRGGTDFWCHEVRTWEPPESLRFLNRKLFRSVAQVKFSFLAAVPAFSLSLPSGTPEVFRLISPIVEQKGRLVATGCAADGVRNTYEWQTRSLTKSDIKRLGAIERGTVLQVEKIERVGQNLRVSGTTEPYDFSLRG